MPTPSKFNDGTRKAILEALRIGASKRTAAAIAGIDPAQLSRWLKKADSTAEGSRWRQFRDEVIKAEAEPKLRALTVVHREMEDDSRLAWKFIERREEGFEPPMPKAPSGPGGPVVIALKLSDGARVLPTSVVEVLESESTGTDTSS